MSYIIFFLLLMLPIINFGQVINLRSSADYVLFTTAGAIATNGISHVSGNIGNTAGAISTFGNVDGVIHNGDATSLLVSSDVLNTYVQLDASITSSILGPILGYGQHHNAGVYSIASAATLNECLTLDARGDPNALFIFKIQGAFVVGPSAKISLINGALACNVFWNVEGAISVGAGTFMRGTLLANNGAIAMAAGDTLEGRALSTTGAISIDGTIVTLPKGCGSVVLTGPSSPSLGSTTNYAVFSANGLLSDDGFSSVNGEVGTNLGSTIGFNPIYVTDTIHFSVDSSTILCANDLLQVYQFLDSLNSDIELLYPSQLGNNLVLTPHVYLINSAATLTDILYLNAEGNENAVFVMKINGALTTGVFANVKLINKAQSKNVFWLIHGALSLNNNSIFRGMVVCDHAAIVFNAGARLDGTMFTTTGNITLHSDIISKTNITSLVIPNISHSCPILSVLPIELLSFTANCHDDLVNLAWSTATEINNDFFSIERSLDGENWQLIHKIKAAGNASSFHQYGISELEPYNKLLYYRLKQTDFDGNYKYSATIAQNICNGNNRAIYVYPNPSTEGLSIYYGEDIGQILSISVLNTLGEIIGHSTMTTTIPVENLKNGIYFLKVDLVNKSVVKKFVVLSR